MCVHAHKIKLTGLCKKRGEAAGRTEAVLLPRVNNLLTPPDPEQIFQRAVLKLGRISRQWQKIFLFIPER